MYIQWLKMLKPAYAKTKGEDADEEGNLLGCGCGVGIRLVGCSDL